MDTVRLGIEDPGVVERLLTRIEERSLPIGSRNPGAEVKGQVKWYNYKRSFWINGHHLFIAWDRYLETVPRATVEFKCSDFRTFKEVLDWLAYVFQQDLPKVLEGSLRRLDVCLDVSLPIQTITETLYKKRCVRVSKWKSTSGRTYYLQGNNVNVRCYEKEVPVDTVDWGMDRVVSDEYGKVWITRIEVEFRGKKVPIRTFSEIQKLPELNPFEDLAFREIDPVLLSRIPQGRTRDMLLAYLHEAQTNGGQIARLERNKDGNFDRTIGKYLGKLELDLGDVWRRKCARFFRKEGA